MFVMSSDSSNWRWHYNSGEVSAVSSQSHNVSRLAVIWLLKKEPLMLTRVTSMGTLLFVVYLEADLCCQVMTVFLMPVSTTAWFAACHPVKFKTTSIILKNYDTRSQLDDYKVLHVPSELNWIYYFSEAMHLWQVSCTTFVAVRHYVQLWKLKITFSLRRNIRIIWWLAFEILPSRRHAGSLSVHPSPSQWRAVVFPGQKLFGNTPDGPTPCPFHTSAPSAAADCTRIQHKLA